MLDLARALSIPGDQLQNVQNLINQFNFERETLRVCRNHGLKGVASALQDGRIDIEGNSIGVYYIVFELAQGDVRKQLSKLQQIDLSWLLRTVHQIAVGLFQLHRRGIAHQDVKPSNVLIFPERAKIADLGCADVKDQVCPRGGYQIAGDRSYAPPELLYGDISGEWDRRRLGTDMYLFGSLVTFLFTGVSTTAVVMSNLSPNHRPGFWPKDYRTVLPYVRDAFGQMLADVRQALPESVRKPISEAIDRLCDPDPNTRGHHKDLDCHQFNFERFVSQFDLLATKAEMGLLKI